MKYEDYKSKQLEDLDFRLAYIKRLEKEAIAGMALADAVEKINVVASWGGCDKKELSQFVKGEIEGFKTARDFLLAGCDKALATYRSAVVDE